MNVVKLSVIWCMYVVSSGSLRRREVHWGDGDNTNGGDNGDEYDDDGGVVTMMVMETETETEKETETETHAQRHWEGARGGGCQMYTCD